MEALKEFKDNQFNLAIIDPPYGIGISGQKEVKKKRAQRNRSGAQNRKYHKEKKWDNEIPNKEYFKQLFRVSKNQIIWGANYFVEHLNKGKKGWVIWDKQQKGLWSSDGEIAYTSFNKPTRIFLQNRIILQQEGGTIHPTQKPVKLYEFLLMTYAKEGDKILEIGTGSGYQAAILSEIGCKVYSIERHRDLYLKAKKNLFDLNVSVKLFYGDGYLGLPDYSPFDKIIVTAGAPEVPDQLKKQLIIGGILVIPVGIGSQNMKVILKTGLNDYELISEYKNFKFVPLLRKKQ